MRSRLRKAFTLLELLVVLAIFAVLMALLMSAIQNARLSAARLTCQNNLRQIALAAHHYAANHGTLPPGEVLDIPEEPHRGMSWLTHLLPYVEQDALWQKALADWAEQPGNAFTPPHTGIRTPVRLFACPMDSRQFGVHIVPPFNILYIALTGYVGVHGTNYYSNDGVFYPGSKTRLESIKDGTSNTLLAGERVPQPAYGYGWWYACATTLGLYGQSLGVREVRPKGYYFGEGTEKCPVGPFHFHQTDLKDPCFIFHYWSFHPGGANFALCDGSVRFFPYEADHLLPALATRAGGEVPEFPP